MRTSILLVASTLWVGCATSQIEALNSTISEQNQQLTELRQVQASLSVTVEDLETRLFLIKDEFETSRSRNGSAVRRMNELPVVRVSPQAAATQAPPPATMARAQPPTRGVLVFDRLDNQGNVIRGGGSVSSPSAATTSNPTATERDVLPQIERDAMNLYRTSMAHLRGDRYQEAIVGFTNFVERYPTHGYADNAIYWMGECYYARGLWMKSLETFQQVIQSYPLGNKAPDSMLKAGLCHLKLRNHRQGREVLEQVVQFYPSNPVARIARERLEQSQ